MLPPPPLHRRAPDGSFQEVPPDDSRPTALSAASAWVKARAREKSTAIGALSAITLSPELWQYGLSALAALEAGDYLRAVFEIFPVISGIIVTLGAVIYPEKSNA